MLKKMSKPLYIKMTAEDYKLVKETAKRKAFDSVSAYVRYLIRADSKKGK